MVGNGFLILRDLVMTAATNLVDIDEEVRKGELLFYSNYDGFFHKVRKEYGYNSFVNFDGSRKEIGYYLFTLSSIVLGFEPCPIALNYSRKLGDAISVALDGDHHKSN
jgi:hypothetical protein